MYESWMILRHFMLGLAVAALVRACGFGKTFCNSLGFGLAVVATAVALSLKSGEATVYALLAICLVLIPLAALHLRRIDAKELSSREQAGRLLTAFAVALLGFFAISAYPPDVQ